MSKQLSSHQFEEVYKKLKINVNDLGCIMLDVDGSKIPEFPMSEKDLYVSKDPEKFWIKGFVAGKTPHVTLLYGLLEPGKEWKEHVDAVLEDWDLDSVTVEKVSYFESQYKDEPYYCIVAHLEISPELLEGHHRLQFLPHIDTFAGKYKAHITLAYVKKDEEIRDNVIYFYNEELKDKELPVKGINYGGKKE